MRNQSAFLYDMDGTTYESFPNPNFLPFFFSNLSQSDFDVSFCGSSRSCFEDWIKTKDISRAVASKAFEDELMRSRYKLGKIKLNKVAGLPPVSLN